MIQGIYTSASAADGLQRWNDVIARNMTASSIPGFKKDTAGFAGVVSGTLQFGVNTAHPDQTITVSPRIAGGVSFEDGTMQHTNDPMEFAIEGEGMFKLQRPDGTEVYTRDGEFNLSSTGQLVSKQGYPVVGDGGPIQTLIDGGPISVTADGHVRQKTQEIGAFTIYKFQSPSNLQRTAGGFMVDPNRPQDPQPSDTAKINQGYLEGSNVNPMHEMADLITVNNALQANLKVIQSFDGMMDRAVQVLGAT